MEITLPEESKKEENKEEKAVLTNVTLKIPKVKKKSYGLSHYIGYFLVVILTTYYDF